MSVTQCNGEYAWVGIAVTTLAHLPAAALFRTDFYSVRFSVLVPLQLLCQNVPNSRRKY